MKKSVLALLLCGIVALGLMGCSSGGSDSGASTSGSANSKTATESDTASESQQGSLGNVEPEIVNTLVAKLNAEIMDGNLNTPAYDNSLVVDNGVYWYAITDDISLYIMPVEFTDDVNADIVDYSGLLIDCDTYDETAARSYVTKLVKANNLEMTDEQVDVLFQEALEFIDTPDMANNGNGLWLGVTKSDDHYDYQVQRVAE